VIEYSVCEVELSHSYVPYKEEEEMKKLLIVVLALGLVLAFAVGCNSESEEPTVEDVAATEQEAADTAADDNGSVQEFVDIQNSIFEGMATDELVITVTAEGTVIKYTYTFLEEGLYDQIGATSFEEATSEGGILLSTAQTAVPEITAVIVEFVDADGNVLNSAEFN